MSRRFVPPNTNNRTQPEDEEDRAMNQALAAFFLDDFEGSMRKKFGLAPENCT